MRNSKGVLATITVLTSNCGDLTKTFYVDANEKVQKNSTPNFSGGSYEVIEIHSLKELKELRRRLKSSQAFMFSTPTNGTLIGSITTKNRRFGRTLSRSLDCFRHPAGGGVLPIDYDPRSGTKPLSLTELVNQLFSVFPALRETQLLWATSAGSCIYDASTDKEHFGIKGQRIYILVKDGSDITRALNVLAMRLWLAGHGWIKVSKSGQKLRRTLVDLTLANAVQPDFAAGAVCHPPLEQRSKQKLIGQGEPLDTRIAIPNLTSDENVRLAKLYADAEAAVADEVKAARELWLNEYGDRAIQRAAAAGNVLTEEEIAGIRDAAVTALDNGILTGDFLITLADGAQVTVADILNSPARYHGALCLDPLEPEYDDYRVVGKIFIGANAWEVFQNYVDTDTPPPYTEQDTKVRTDAVWKTAAEAYRGWKDVADDAMTKADIAKAKLVELATHSRESGYGVSVTRYWKQGNVDYKKVVELQGVDLEQYRGKSREEVRVTVAA